MLIGIGCEGQLCGDRINGIQNIINLPFGANRISYGLKKGFQILWEHKFLKGSDLDVRADIRDALLHDLGLIASYGAVEGNALAVYICEGYGVVVDQDEAAHTAACQGIHRMGANAANAEDGNRGLL